MRRTSFCIIRCYPQSEDGLYNLQSSSWEIHPMDFFEHWMQKRTNLIREIQDVFVLKDLPFLVNDGNFDVCSVWLKRSELNEKRQQLYTIASNTYDNIIGILTKDSENIDKNKAFHDYIKEIKEADKSINEEFTEFLSNFEKLEFDNDIQEG